MAKITVAGKAIVLTSSLKREDIKLIEKHRPEALTIYSTSDDGKEPVFMLRAGEKDSINEFGISFAGETHDEKLASLTAFFPFEENENIRETVADMFGTAVKHLEQLEDSLPTVVEEIKSERAEIMSNIDIIA